MADQQFGSCHGLDWINCPQRARAHVLCAYRVETWFMHTCQVENKMDGHAWEPAKTRRELSHACMNMHYVQSLMGEIIHRFQPFLLPILSAHSLSCMHSKANSLIIYIIKYNDVISVINACPSGGNLRVHHFHLLESSATSPSSVPWSGISLDRSDHISNILVLIN